MEEVHEKMAYILSLKKCKFKHKETPLLGCLKLEEKETFIIPNVGQLDPTYILVEIQTRTTISEISLATSY